MRAAALVDVGRFEVRSVPCPEPGTYDVRVRVRAVGVCGTDLHIASGEANYNRDVRGRAIPLADEPQILGHEIAGVVDACGPAVRDLAPGDPVVLDQGRTCVSERRSPVCDYCATGDSHQCAHYREHGISGLPGGFAEYVTLPAVNAVRMQPTTDFAVAALAEPLGCVIHAMAVLRRMPARFHLDGAAAKSPVRTILLCGAGPSGLLIAQHLRRVAGFDGLLLVAEPNDHKRALAESLGAEGVQTSVGRVGEAVRERTDGAGVELLIDASGAGAVFRLVPEVLCKQGTLLLYGHGHGGVDLSVLNAVQFLEPTIVSPVGASGGHESDGRPSTYVQALRLIERGTIEVAQLITHRYTSLDAVADAFGGDHTAPHYVKGVVTLGAN